MSTSSLQSSNAIVGSFSHTPSSQTRRASAQGQQPDRPATALELAQDGVARKLVRHLDESAMAMPSDLSERLKVARGQALSQARLSRLARVKAGQMSLAGSDRAGTAGTTKQSPFTWSGLTAALLPLILLVAGLVAIEYWSQREHIMTAADIDAQLLSDDLPPAAYADPGFAEYLRSGRLR